MGEITDGEARHEISQLLGGLVGKADAADVGNLTNLRRDCVHHFRHPVTQGGDAPPQPSRYRRPSSSTSQHPSPLTISGNSR